jgi:hypothetical protein
MSAVNEDQDNRLSALMLLTLHLAPGIGFALFFFALARILIQFGVTAYLAVGSVIACGWSHIQASRNDSAFLASKMERFVR